MINTENPIQRRASIRRAIMKIREDFERTLPALQEIEFDERLIDFAYISRYGEDSEEEREST